MMTRIRLTLFASLLTTTGMIGAASHAGVANASEPEHQRDATSDGSQTAQKSLPTRARLITADQVALVQAEKVTEEDVADGVLGYELTIARSLDDEGELVSGTAKAAPLGKALTDVIIKNPGPDTAFVTAMIDGEMREFVLAPGHGLAIGNGTSRAFAGATHYCVCECITESGTVRDSWVCGDGSSACDCDAFNGVRCRANKEQGEVYSCFCELRFKTVEF